MKKVALFFALLVAGFLSARAQEYRHEINLSEGFLPRVLQEIDRQPALTGDLASIYEPRIQAKGGPLTGVDYAYAVLPWLKLGGSLDYTWLEGSVSELFRGVVVNQFKRHYFYLMPQAKLFALDLPHFKIYGKVAAGMECILGDASVSPVNFAWQLTPIGLQWAGQRVYGSLEITNGHVLQGVRLGVGFRF